MYRSPPRAIVSAGLAKEVDALNHYAAVIYPHHHRNARRPEPNPGKDRRDQTECGDAF